MKQPYKIVLERKGCSKCKHDREWGILSPDGYVLALTFLDKDDAQWWKDQLNDAYFLGKKCSKTSS